MDPRGIGQGIGCAEGRGVVKYRPNRHIERGSLGIEQMCVRGLENRCKGAA